MKIGLIDVDGHNFPNFALMKISAYHKSVGDDVQWYDIFSGHFDMVYMSKVFTFSTDYLYPIDADIIEKGGTGYDIKKKLPKEIEECLLLDYSIYPQYNFSVQFFSRGCIRHCPFCLVHDKEGLIRSTTPHELNPDGKWIEVLDNNFFANPKWEYAVEYLKAKKQPVKFHGVDVRIMSEYTAKALNCLKLKGGVHIAWDLPQLDLRPQIESMLKWIKPDKINCYVLVGFNSTRDQDLFRLRTLKEYGILPFVQPYRDFSNKRKPTQYEKDISRWANRMWLFNTRDFMDYEPRKGFKCSTYFNDKNYELDKTKAPLLEGNNCVSDQGRNTLCEMV